MKLKINRQAMIAKLEQGLELAKEEYREDLREIAVDLGSRTPVDTGALAESWSVNFTRDSGGRSVSSRERPRKQAPGPFRAKAIENMNSDISRLNLERKDIGVSFRNKAPHAPYERVALRDRVLNPVIGKRRKE